MPEALHRYLLKTLTHELLWLLTYFTYKQRCYFIMLHISLLYRYSYMAHRELLPEGNTAFCSYQEKDSTAQLQSSLDTFPVRHKS